MKKNSVVIAHRFRITSDNHNYIVERRTAVKDEDTGEKKFKWGKPHYFKDIGMALNDIVDDNLLKPKGRMKVQDLIERIEKVRRLVSKVGKRCVSLWGIE